MTKVSSVGAGVDGCRGGWALALLDLAGRLDWSVQPTLAAALSLCREAPVVMIDIPIGLPEVAEPGGRLADRSARALLGGRAGASVFSPPCRRAIGATTYREALELQRSLAPKAPGFSLQAWNIVPKIREADAIITPELQEHLREAHPELAWRHLAGTMEPPLPPKRTRVGREARERLLDSAGLAPHRPPLLEGAAADDLLDAAVLAWLSTEAAQGRARVLPEGSEQRDGRGLICQIWW